MTPPPPPAPTAEPSTGPRITRRLRAWWALLAGLLVALGFVATDHMWRATASMSVSLILAAGLRAVLPDESAGGLVVRRRWLEVCTLLGLAVAVAVAGFSLDLTALV